MKTKSILIACFALPLSASAQEETPPIGQEELAKAETGALELDTIEVTSSLSVQQEAALRIVRQALDEPRSLKREDFDKWRCWFDKPVGTHLNHLYCARNGDLWALQPKGGNNPTGYMTGGGVGGGDLLPPKIGGYGQVLISERPINKLKLRRMLRHIPGEGGNDQTFINMVLKGEKPPRDVPGEAELDRFATAWKHVDGLADEGADEDRQIQAIINSGLTLERYNRIATLVEEYGYVREQVAARIGASGG